jgi:hypothetical protein
MIAKEGLNPSVGFTSHKVPGPDNIIPRVLKELATHISPILTIIFRKSYNTGNVMHSFKLPFHVADVFERFV